MIRRELSQGATTQRLFRLLLSHVNQTAPSPDDELLYDTLIDAIGEPRASSDHLRTLYIRSVFSRIVGSLAIQVISELPFCVGEELVDDVLTLHVDHAGKCIASWEDWRGEWRGLNCDGMDDVE